MVNHTISQVKAKKRVFKNSRNTSSTSKARTSNPIIENSESVKFSNTSITSPQPRARQSYKFLPALWTVASVVSLTIDLVLIILLLFGVRMSILIQLGANNQISGLLGGLYSNFEKIDQAVFRTNVNVESTIPVNFVLDVEENTSIVLSKEVTIPNARIRINTDNLNIDTIAAVTLPANTSLPVNINFPINVKQNIPIYMNVPVSIPLNQTELHEPLVGLQQVLKPYYCIFEPNAVTINGIKVCTQ